MIHSSEKLNSNLALIKFLTRKPSRIILEEIISPLALALSGKREPCGYWVSIQGDSINIQCYGASNIQSGKITNPLGLNDVIRIS